MAISDLDVKQQFPADGAETDFAIPYAMVFDDSVETKVYVDDTLQTEGDMQDYTLIGAPDVNSFHVNVRFNTAPADGTTVTLIRQLTLDQALDLVSAGTINLQTLETHLDGIVAKIQQLAEMLERVPKLKITTPLADQVMPDPVAGYILAWNSLGTQLENVSTSSTADPIGYTVEAIAASGTIDSVTTTIQYRPVVGSGGAVSASTTPFGSAGGWQTGTMIVLKGTDDTNTVTFTHNDAQYGAIMNGNITLTNHDVIAFVYDSVDERWIEMWRNK